MTKFYCVFFLKNYEYTKKTKTLTAGSLWDIAAEQNIRILVKSFQSVPLILMLNLDLRLMRHFASLWEPEQRSHSVSN